MHCILRGKNISHPSLKFNVKFYRINEAMKRAPFRARSMKFYREASAINSLRAGFPRVEISALGRTGAEINGAHCGKTSAKRRGELLHRHFKPYVDLRPRLFAVKPLDHLVRGEFIEGFFGVKVALQIDLTHRDELAVFDLVFERDLF